MNKEDLEKEIKDLSKAAIMVAFDDSNKDTELLLRVLLKYGKIELKNGKYTRTEEEWEENMTLVGYQMEREKSFWIKEDSLDEYTKQLERQIEIKDEYLKLIIDLGFDYDGYEKSESLKSLIDELVNLAKNALDNNDKAVIYENVKGEYNILTERIKNENNSL